MCESQDKKDPKPVVRAVGVGADGCEVVRELHSVEKMEIDVATYDEAADASSEDIQAALAEVGHTADVVLVLSDMEEKKIADAAVAVARFLHPVTQTTLGVVTRPTSLEKGAEDDGIRNFGQSADAVILFPSRESLSLPFLHLPFGVIATPNLSRLSGFGDRGFLCRGLQDLIHLLVSSYGLAGYGLDDRKALFHGGNLALMLSESSSGADALREAAESVGFSAYMAHCRAEGIMLAFTGAESKLNMLALGESVKKIAGGIQSSSKEERPMSWGAVADDAMKDSVRITLLMTGAQVKADEGSLAPTSTGRKKMKHCKKKSCKRKRERAGKDRRGM